MLLDPSLTKPLTDAFCKNTFGRSSLNTTTPEGDKVYVVGTASYSMENGVIDRSTRGSFILWGDESTFAENAVPNFEQIVFRILSNWRDFHGYTEADFQSRIKQHKLMRKERLKFITIEEENSRKFSAIRIYDSSKSLKVFGIDVAYNSPNISLPELLFSNFDLNKSLLTAGITPSSYQWTLGLIEIRETYREALQNLLAQVANLLDQNYNDREMLNANSLNKLKENDVDLIFYANERIKNYYQRIFGIEPLKDENAEYIKLTKEDGSYYLYHMQGSEFLKRFFKLEYLEPSFSSQSHFIEKSLQYREFVQRIKQRLQFTQYTPPKYSSYLNFAKDLLSLMKKINEDITNKVQSIDGLSEYIYQLMRIRSSLSSEILQRPLKRAEVIEIRKMILENIKDITPYITVKNSFENNYQLGKFVDQYIAIFKSNINMDLIHPDAKALEESMFQIISPTLFFTNMIVLDPVTFVINRMVLPAKKL